MKKLINCLFLFFLVASSSTAQTVSSKVVDKESKQPLHYATVAIKDTGKGVITNEDGLFSITIKDTSYSTIVISYLGYKTLELNSENIPSVIYLQEDVKSLQTITVSAYTPITILRKAFERIEENYPQDLTKQIGFYREHSFTDTEDLVYISEGVVEIVKSKYKKKFKNDFGQLKVLKGRTNYFSHHDWASKTGFTGGHLYWNRFDIAKKRMDFINPKHFDEYDYVLRASSVQDGRVVYIISFDNRNGQLKGEWEGTLYIDSESFAYMGADAKSTAIGIKKRNRKEGNEIHNWKEFGFEIRYKKIKERWHLNSNIYTSRIKRPDLGMDVLFKDEFSVTETIVQDVQPIGFVDRLSFNSVFSQQVFNDFDTTFFNDHAILEESEQIKQQIDSLNTPYENDNQLSKEDSIQIETNTSMNRIISKFSMSTGLTSLPISIANDSYSFIHLNSPLEFLSNSNFSGIKNVPGFYGNVNFDLSKRWTVGTGQFHSLNKFVKYSFYDVNLRYNFLLKKVGKPLILQTQVAYWFGQVGLKLENSDQEPSILRLEERNFETDQIIVSVGKRLSAIKSSLNFNYQLSSLAWLQAGIDYYLPVSERSRVFVRDRSDDINELTIPSSYQFKNDDFIINQNEQSISDEFPLDMGRLSFRLGILVDL